jgi:hypothetical protein
VVRGAQGSLACKTWQQRYRATIFFSFLKSRIKIKEIKIKKKKKKKKTLQAIWIKYLHKPIGIILLVLLVSL